MNFFSKSTSLLLVTATLLSLPSALACTVFSLPYTRTAVIGKVFEWDSQGGHLMINKRGVAKRGFHLIPEFNNAEWESKFGSVTFNVAGREFPQSGVNEAGLVVEMLWLDEAKFPRRDSRPGVNELQWVQYQLDNFKTTKEVVQNIEEIRILKDIVSVHYFVCDASKECATIEYLEGEPVVHMDSDKNVNVLANDTFETSLEDRSQYEGFGGDKPIPQGGHSLERFARASALLKKRHPRARAAQINHAFEIAESVSGPEAQFAIVYDLENRELFFTSMKNKTKRRVKLDAFDYSCSKPSKMFPIHSRHRGDVTAKFQTYNYRENREDVDIVTAKWWWLPGFARKLIAEYPESLECVTP